MILLKALLINLSESKRFMRISYIWSVAVGAVIRGSNPLRFLPLWDLGRSDRK